MTHVGNGGMCYIDSIELDELYQPIHVHDRHLVADSEGAGKFRGAPALSVEYGPVDCRIEVGYVVDGHVNTPLGARGGGRGAGATQFLRKKNGDLEPLDQCAQIWIEDGESILSTCCGGGGYGDPKARDLERVRRDVVEGIVTRERAAEVYGVES